MDYLLDIQLNNNSGIFTVSSYYKFLNNEGVYVAWSQIIWQNIASLKVRVLVWLVDEDITQVLSCFLCLNLFLGLVFSFIVSLVPHRLYPKIKFL